VEVEAAAAFEGLLAQAPGSRFEPHALRLLGWIARHQERHQDAENWYRKLADSFPDPLGVGPQVTLVLAVLAEVVCSLLLVLGLGTRVAAVLPLVTMLVAAFVIHAGDPWAKKELALLYAVPYLTLLLAGGGRFALDRVVKVQVKR